MLKLNTRNCSLYIPLYMQKKLTSFCQVLKEMHTKENWFLYLLCIRGTIAMGLCLSVGLSVTSPSSSKTAERIELVFGM